MLTIKQLKLLAKKEKAYITQTRNYLHEHPELRWEENESIAYLQQKIAEIPVSSSLKRTTYQEFSGGLIVDLDSKPTADRILFRADVDALPVNEVSTNEPHSLIPDKMHACGHDAHSAMLLAAYKLIASGEVPSQHNLRFVWQRAEENPGTGTHPESGGACLVKEDVLNNVSQVYGLHLWVTAPKGVFQSRPGSFFANSARIKINVECQGGHASQPEHGVNAIDLLNGVQTVAKEVGEQYNKETNSVEEQVNFVPTIITAGSASNVLPNRGELWFSFRNFFQKQKRNEIIETLREKLAHQGSQVSSNIRLELIDGHPVTVNDTRSFHTLFQLLNNAKQSVECIEPKFAGEDFSYYLQQKRGSFWLLGSANPGSGDHHTPTFNPNPDIFWKGVLFWLLIATSPTLDLQMNSEAAASSAMTP